MMTHAPDAVDFGSPAGETARRRAFRAAGLHSNRVRLLKRMIVIVCTIVFSLLAIGTFFNPFGRLPKGLSVGATSLNGSRISMENPRLSGYRDDGRPYDLRAAYGAQDVRAPNIIELTDLDAKFDTSDQSAVHLIAAKGVYDSSLDTMIMSGDIRITSSAGFDIRLSSATVNFRDGVVVSNEPVTVTMPSGVIAGNKLAIVDHGQKITFHEGVETVFKPAEAAAGEEDK